MKSYPGGAPGNVNMRGKKHKTLSCGCCECTDLREGYQRKLAEKEKMEEALDAISWGYQ